MLITNGTVHLEAGPKRADVLIEGETIRAVGDLKGQAAGEKVIDASGLHVLPGLIDLHVHIDDEINGVPLADTFLTGTRAALQTGITTVVAFATQQPDRSLQETLSDYLDKAKDRSFCDAHFHLTPTTWTPDTWKELDALAGRGFRTLKLYTTYKEAGLYTGYQALKEVMQQCADRDMGLLLHCEDQQALDSAEKTAPRSHALLRPGGAETTAIEKAVQSALETGARLHVVHVSTPDGVRFLDQTRASMDDPERITFETGAQYLLLNDEWLEKENGHRWLCTPPLRSEENRAHLEALAAAGKIPVFASDHCAFSKEDKDRFATDMRKVPKGLPGVGALVPLVFELLHRKHGRDLSDLALRLSANPARVTGLYPRKGAIRPGSDGDVVILDPDGPERAVASSQTDTHEPYPGQTTTLDVRWVLLRGRPVVINNQPVAPDHPEGKSLCSP